MVDGKDSPPPTNSDHDMHVHRREQDRESRHREHARWYDSTKIQLTIAATLIGLLGGALAGGYALRDFTRSVEGSEERWAQENIINEQKWQAINRNTVAIDRLDAERELMLGVMAEIRCMLRASSDSEKRRCSDEEAERRLQALRRSRNP